ncbi:gamma-mobile-trio protein GmtX [Rheinheimera salexigens]|uniref:Uncharacterized protein n=1 Tax=Rheinheimera salexigens TaxID=1628148 RepID=A0A1E7Q3R0_9GAMM|nr:gamma-mobile-trio protein GmtX [Rheinheimera salexigens]OEY68815.1 hypothetical protein BI198_03980 [Rheinheimera salexigens]
MTPKELLDKLKNDATSKVQQTLDAIYQVCLDQQERGIQDFSVATISKLGYNSGVPKAQSIRNKSGEKYRALISAFSESSINKKSINPIKSDEDWIDEISNPKHKLLARILSSELKEAKKQVDEILPPKLRIDVYDHKSERPADEARLTEQERRALEYIISSSFQNKWELEANEYGEMVDSKNKPVFKVATVDAIKKALEYL